MTLSLTNVFQRLFALPVLSIPFVIVSSLIYLAASHYSNIYIDHFAPHPEIFVAFADVLPYGLLVFLSAWVRFCLCRKSQRKNVP